MKIWGKVLFADLGYSLFPVDTSISCSDCKTLIKVQLNMEIKITLAVGHH